MHPLRRPHRCPRLVTSASRDPTGAQDSSRRHPVTPGQHLSVGSSAVWPRSSPRPRLSARAPLASLVAGSTRLARRGLHSPRCSPHSSRPVTAAHRPPRLLTACHGCSPPAAAHRLGAAPSAPPRHRGAPRLGRAASLIGSSASGCSRLVFASLRVPLSACIAAVLRRCRHCA